MSVTLSCNVYVLLCMYVKIQQFKVDFRLQQCLALIGFLAFLTCWCHDVALEAHALERFCGAICAEFAIWQYWSRCLSQGD